MSNNGLRSVAWTMGVVTVVGFGVVTAIRWQRAAEDAERTVTVAASLTADGLEEAARQALEGASPRTTLTWTEDDDTVEWHARARFELPLVLIDGAWVRVDATSHALLPVVAATPVPVPVPEPPPPQPVAPIVPQAPAPPRAREVRVTHVDTRVPKVVLVLDASGSMCRRVGDGALWDCADPSSSWQILRAAVDTFLEQVPEAALGLVVFAAQVSDQVALTPGNADVVRAQLDRPRACPASQSAQCQTATWAGLDAAADLFAASPGEEARYVIFISDGQPSTMGVNVPQGIARSRAAADRLRKLGATLLTIHIVNTPAGQDVLAAFMKSLSGDADAYSAARSSEELRRLFAHIAARPAYTVGPLAMPRRGDELHMLLRTRDGVETELREGRVSHGGTAYARTRRGLQVTREVAERVNERGDTLILRIISPG